MSAAEHKAVPFPVSVPWSIVHMVCAAVALGFGCGCGDGSPLDRTESLHEALQQCAASTVEGIDIYDGTGSVTWSAVKAAGIDFAIIKAAQGTYNSQSTFASAWSGAKAAGLVRSAYHFFDPTEDGVAQAQHFLSVVGTLAPDDLPAMLDIECPDGSSNCLGTGASGATPASTIHQRMWDWIHTVQTTTGKAPLIYTYGSYFSSNGIDTTGLQAYPLNLADVTTASCFNVPSPWQKAAIWQYSWTGTVHGIPGQVDRDRFLGTLSDLQAFALGGASAGNDAMAAIEAMPSDAYAGNGDAEGGAKHGADASLLVEGGGVGAGRDAQGDVANAREGSDSGADAMGGSGGAAHASSGGCECHVEAAESDRGLARAVAMLALATGLARRRRTACGRSRHAR
jgi:lysozyme